MLGDTNSISDIRVYRFQMQLLLLAESHLKPPMLTLQVYLLSFSFIV